jgi:hypothetical protein
MGIFVQFNVTDIYFPLLSITTQQLSIPLLSITTQQLSKSKNEILIIVVLWRIKKESISKHKRMHFYWRLQVSLNVPESIIVHKYVSRIHIHHSFSLKIEISQHLNSITGKEKKTNKNLKCVLHNAVYEVPNVNLYTLLSSPVICL